MSTRVSRGQLGWIEDGPFQVYLSGENYGATVYEAFGGAVTDVSLGELIISPSGDHADVSIEFALPGDVPRGEYRVVVCNEPCTTGLGDLIGGILYVGLDPGPDPRTVAGIGQPVEASVLGALALTETGEVVSKATSPAYQALVPHRSPPAGLSAAWMVVSAGLAALALGILVLSLRKPESR